MFRKKYTFIAVLLFIVAVMTDGTNGATQYDWKLEKTKNGCQIYTSKSPGKEYIAAKCVAVIDARMDEIGVVLRDIAAFPEWMEDCVSTKMLKVVNDDTDTFIFYLHQHVPILTDRDLILKSNVILDYRKGYASIETFSTKEFPYPEQPKRVRMPHFRSLWYLEWIDKDHTRATFMIDPNLGPGLPVGIANSTIEKLPYKSMLGMMKMVKKQKYIDASRTSKYRKLIDQAVREGYPKK